MLKQSGNKLVSNVEDVYLVVHKVRGSRKAPVLMRMNVYGYRASMVVTVEITNHPHVMNAFVRLGTQEDIVNSSLLPLEQLCHPKISSLLLLYAYSF